MGDRVSISFRNGDEESVVLFSHWGGMTMVKDAVEYAKELQKERKNNPENNHGLMPLDRLEPSVVMVDFIRQITHKMKRVEGGLYLGKDSEDGDNSDNGHHIIDTEAKYEQESH
jgi:hypothetical protein